MNIIHIQSREDFFYSRFFDFQKSHKYLITLDDGRRIETTCFEHFLNKNKTDIAIDITTMDGCPMQCLFCASSSLKFNRYLSEEEILYQVNSMVDKYSSNDIEQITCSFQGIGEPTLVPDIIVNSSKKIQSIDKRIVISLSTICTDVPSFFTIANSGILFDNIQFTLVGTRNSSVVNISQNSPSPDIIVEIAKKIIKYPNIHKVKVNYILIGNINDFDSDMNFLIENFQNSGIIVKFSYLNKTLGSTRNKFHPIDARTAEKYSKKLQKNGVDSYVFGAFANIEMSCGQLNVLEKQ